ncbi:uncharacterized protein LOC119077428 isoform X2 [Bradysia coprophila]|uniref:uncharacterized protein LOC119077428 isoform X2 n=1 Tax=Bradysia coprophila TaxID=38358 RepID=UPI00187DA9EA|nr:uncharacterized protein LOC119077428 isoform X2 [Bradysia coprophila]
MSDFGASQDGNYRFSCFGFGNSGNVTNNMNGKIRATQSSLQLHKNYQLTCDVEKSNIVAKNNFNLVIKGQNHEAKIQNTFGVALEKQENCTTNIINIAPKNSRNGWFARYFGIGQSEEHRSEGNRNFNVLAKYCNAADVENNQFNMGIFKTKVEKLPNNKDIVCVEIDRTTLDPESFRVERHGDAKFIATATKDGKPQSIEISGPSIKYMDTTGEFHVFLYSSAL